MADIENRWRVAARDEQLAAAARQQLPLMVLFPLVAIGHAPPHWLAHSQADGTVVVPCYLSEAAARHAAGAKAQVVRASGRDFLESLGPRYLWVDPEGVGLLLSPQQLRELLNSVIPPEPIGTDQTLSGWCQADDLPGQVRACWIDVLRQFPSAQAAYWLARSQEGSRIRRFVVLTAPGEDLSRLMLAMTHVLRENYAGELRIEAQAITRGELPEAEDRLRDLVAFYPP